jgi:predicted dehydrogenase
MLAGLMDSTLGVAVFGAGRAGAGHARAVTQTPGTQLVAVFDVDQQRASAFAETHGCLAFTDSDET